MRFRFSTPLTIVCCGAALLLVACENGDSVPAPAATIIGSGIIVSETRVFPPFDGIDTGIADARIDILQGGPQSVRVETDDNIIDDIDTAVGGGVLRITSDRSYDTNHGVRVEITMAAVASLRLGGVGTIAATGLSSTGTLSVDLVGVGDIDLDGAVDVYDAVQEGVGGIDAEKLTARFADIDLRGVGDCRITVTDRLLGTISGTGDIYYAGSPSVVIPNITGNGSLIQIP